MTHTRRFVVLLLSFFGIVDATYLTKHALSGIPTACTINGYDGCSIVAQSAYSHLFGLPLSMYGFLFYASLFVLTAITLVWVSVYIDKIIVLFATLRYIYAYQTKTITNAYWETS